MQRDHRTGLVLRPYNLGTGVCEREDLDVGRLLGEEGREWTQREEGHVCESEGDEVRLGGEDVEMGGCERGG